MTRALLWHADALVRARCVDALAALGLGAVECDRASRDDLVRAPLYVFDGASPRALAYALGLREGRPTIGLVCLGRLEDAKDAERLSPCVCVSEPSIAAIAFALRLAARL